MKLLSVNVVYSNNNRKNPTEIDISRRKLTVIAQNVLSIDEAIESEDVPTANSIIRLANGQTFACTDELEELLGRWERALL